MFDNSTLKILAILGPLSHLTEDMEDMKGVGEFTEDFVEKDHQESKKEQVRCQPIKGAEKSAAARINIEEAAENPLIKEAVDAMTAATARGSYEKNREELHLNKEVRDAARKQLLEMGELDYKLGSVKKMLQEKRKIILQEVED